MHIPTRIAPLPHILAACLLCLVTIACGPREEFEPPEGEGPWVLVDLYHTRIQNHEDYRLTKGNYNYQGVFGYARAFDHLESNGYRTRTIREIGLSPQRLEGFDVLFINLVHSERPNFTDDEVEAIKDFVRDGGGLYVVADHTNVYRHAERVNRFLTEMGIKVTYHTAIDYGEQSVSGLGWIAIEDLADHPVNQDVEMISFQTGGTMAKSNDNSLVTARLSERGLADYWNEDELSGFYGNWSFDGDPDVEPQGAIPVGMVAQYGEGRVVVAGDQNMFGDAWLHFGNNFDYFMNGMEWLAKRDGVADPALRDAPVKGLSVGVESRLTDYATGTGGDDAYYNFFVHTNRDQEVTGRGILEFDGTDDAIVLPSPTISPSQKDLQDILSYLEDGKRVVLTFEASQLADATYRPTLEVLQALAPDFTMEVDGTSIEVKGSSEEVRAALANLDFPRYEQASALESDRLDVDDIELASAALIRDGDDARREPYLLKLTSSWGEPLVRATDAGADIARSKRVGTGELIIVVQDGFWRGRTLGSSESSKPPEIADGAIDLEYALLDYLKEDLPPCDGACAPLPSVRPVEKPSGPNPWVLVDLHHTTIQNPVDYRLDKGVYGYQGVHGYARAFDHLDANDYEWRAVRQGPLTAEILEGYDVLFINLVHDQRPDFTDDEVALIVEYVRGGGGLFVIADHTNVYRHAERVNRFLKQMGIEVTYHTAVDYDSQSVNGIGWIAIEDLEDHPVNQDVEMISFQTGGTMTRSGAPGNVIARLSERGFADYWDESDTGGFYGNWSFDGNEAIEPRGEVPVGMAAEFGEGRVLVAGDQNMFGDVWLHFGDNFSHFMNGMEWLARRDGPDTPLRDAPPKGTIIALESGVSGYVFGNGGSTRYYSVFHHFNRDQEVSAFATPSPSGDEDVLVVTAPQKLDRYNTAYVEMMRGALEAGKKVVVLMQPDIELKGSAERRVFDLIAQLAPDFSLSAAGRTVAFDQPYEELIADLQEMTWTRQPGVTTFASEALGIDGIEGASYTDFDEGGSPFILNVRSSWGEPLIQTSGGADIARHKQVGDGELIIFVQDALFRNQTLGNKETTRPQENREGVVTLLYTLLDYLKGTTP